MNYTKHKFEFGADLRFNSKKDIEDFNFNEGIDNHDLTPIIDTSIVDVDETNYVDKYYGTPSWMTIGVNGRYLINDKLSVQARLSNLFDEHYVEFASGVSAPGRNLSVSFVANF